MTQFAKETLPISLEEEMRRSYLDYAMSVIVGRALPDARDGLKPVHRRVLFAMHELNNDWNRPYKKSARIVGDVIGKDHPHGDSAVYDTIVRMAQDFSLRHMLVDGQGNFGSVDGDNAAAMRYTEIRLAKIAHEMLDDLDKETVDFGPNYDGSEKEPLVLPAKFPNLLVNGSAGIAVGMATEIPSHNLNEVAAAAMAVIKQPKISHDELMALIPGPDFPGGGQIITSKTTISEIYQSGRGSIKVRARWKIEDLARGQWQLVVTELPPGTSSQKILEEIEELTNPKVKLGKKSLTPDQLGNKQTILSVLDTVRDESGREAAVRLVFEPKSKNQDQEEFSNLLLAHTSLENSVGVNFVMIGADGRPRQKGIGEILREWVGFRFDTVTRRTQHRLGKVDDRIHILEGREAVLLNIDKVIKIIRESDEPKPALMKAFKLSERQAEDILEIRLRQLARLEAIKVQQELSELRKEKKTLQELLDNPSSMKKLLIKEIETDAKTYGDKRRTLIKVAEKAVAEVKIIDEPVTVIISQKGWVRARQAHGHDAAQFSFKAGDALYATFECRTTDNVLAFGSNGRVYTIAVAQLPGARGDGVPLTTLAEVETGTRLVHYFVGLTDTTLLLASTGGFGFAAKVGDMISRQKAGKAFMAMDEGDEPVRPSVIVKGASALACLSEQGRMLVFGLDEIKTQSGGGRGVTLMDLDPKEKLIAAQPISQKGVRILGTAQRSGKPQEVILTGKDLAHHFGKRARKGKLLASRLRATSLEANS